MAIFTESFKYLLLVCISIQSVFSANQMVIYWGQNSAGSITNVASQQEQPLRHYCQDSSYDIIVVGFVYLFPSASGNTDPTLPGMNFANHCEVPFNSANPFVLNCTTNVAPDIQYCQSVGKKIFLSFGGGVGTYGFSSDAQAVTFANTVWNMFLGGNGAIRPFGNAVFDGVDLDIEGGATTGYIQFIATLRAYFAAQTSRTYYISSAPQCFYPDRLGPGAGTPLTEAWFDYIWICQP
jgi:chitinase